MMASFLPLLFSLFLLSLFTSVCSSFPESQSPPFFPRFPSPPSTPTARYLSSNYVPTPLDLFVYPSPPSPLYSPIFQYTLRNEFTVHNSTYSVYWLNATSQSWLTKSITPQCHIWYHDVLVIVPSVFPSSSLSSTIIWNILGSHNSPTPPKYSDINQYEYLVHMSTTYNVIVGGVFNLPNEPCYFYLNGESSGRRVEDGVIAWGWRKYIDGYQSNGSIMTDEDDTDDRDDLEYFTNGADGQPSPGGDPRLIPQFPMVLGAIRSMDCVEDFITNYLQIQFFTNNPNNNSSLPITFLIMGESKRGWLTWLITGLDNRVIAAAPIVMSALNFQHNLHHYFRQLGGWSFALWDYWNENITSDLDSPETFNMMKSIDPIHYYERYKGDGIPIYYTGVTGDEFFQPDDWAYWNLPQDDINPSSTHFPFYFDMIHNCEHDFYFCYPALFGRLNGFVDMVVTTMRIYNTTKSDIWPLYSFNTLNPSGEILLNTTYPSLSSSSPLPLLSVTSYGADTDSPYRRDFRIAIMGPDGPNGNPSIQPIYWIHKEITDNPLGSGQYSIDLLPPEKGWSGMFLLMEWGMKDGGVFTTTTTISIIKQDFFYEACYGRNCTGVMV